MYKRQPQDEQISEAAFGQYNAVLWAQFGMPDPMIDNVWLVCETVGGISLNWPRYCSEERDTLLYDAMATVDEAERIALYQEQTAQMNQEYMYVFLVHNVNTNAYAPEVRGQCDRESPDGVPLRCAYNTRTWHSGLWLAE